MNPLQTAGERVLKALGKHSALLMEMYLNKGVLETHENEKQLAKLASLNVVWNPPETDIFRLRKSFRDAIELAIRPERNRQLDANLGSAYEELLTLISHYHSRKKHCDYEGEESALEEINELVYSITESLQVSVNTLWQKINAEFGFARTVQEKLQENELAMKRVTSILDGLDVFDYKELAVRCGASGGLRGLLLQRMYKSTSSAHADLLVAQGRLTELMGRFRERQLQTRKINALLKYVDDNPSFEFMDYTEVSNIPRLLNVAQSSAIEPHVDVHNDFDLPFLSNLVAEMVASHGRTAKEVISRESGTIEEPITKKVTYKESLEEKLIDGFFCYALDNAGTNISAVVYHKSSEMEVELEYWLNGVICKYQALEGPDAQYFNLELSTIPNIHFSANTFITDVKLCVS